MKIDWEKVAPIAGQMADVVTTRYALKQPGTMEGNPFMRGIVGKPGLFLVVKLGMGLGAAAAVKVLQDRGQRKTAKVASIVATLLGAAPAANNLLRKR